MIEISLKAVECLSCGNPFYIPKDLPDNFVCDSCMELHKTEESHEIIAEQKEEEFLREQTKQEKA